MCWEEGTVSMLLPHDGMRWQLLDLRLAITMLHAASFLTAAAKAGWAQASSR